MVMPAHRYPSAPWHGQGPRKKLVRSGAQHARYFLLGLAVVSLFVGLNVFLASQTAALKVRIREVERECQELEWVNAELVSEIALATNIDASEIFALRQGFTSPQQFVHLAPNQDLRLVSALGRSSTDLLAGSNDVADIADQTPIWQQVLDGIQRLVSALLAGERVAALR
jgi:hypothetical protein